MIDEPETTDDPTEEKMEDDAPLSERLTRAIKHTIFGGGKDIELPLEPGRKADPTIAKRAGDQAMGNLQSYAKKLSEGSRGERVKELQRKGMSEAEASKKAIKE